MSDSIQIQIIIYHFLLFFFAFFGVHFKKNRSAQNSGGLHKIYDHLDSELPSGSWIGEFNPQTLLHNRFVLVYLFRSLKF